MLKATVSGSFHRHMGAIYRAVGELKEAGLDVLSPADPRVVDYVGDFLFVASDKLRSIKLVQDRHLRAIRSSDFLWVECPDGYTGPSVSMEIGAAYAFGIPVYSITKPGDSTLQAYVNVVPSMCQAIAAARHERRALQTPHVLLDPVGTIEQSHALLDGLRPYLTGLAGDGRGAAEDRLSFTARTLKDTFAGHGS